MGITVHQKTKCPESLKLANTVASFLFEQECGELKYFTEAQKKHIQNACKALYKVSSKNQIK